MNVLLYFTVYLFIIPFFSPSIFLLKIHSYILFMLLIFERYYLKSSLLPMSSILPEFCYSGVVQSVFYDMVSSVVPLPLRALIIAASNKSTRILQLPVTTITVLFVFTVFQLIRKWVLSLFVI